jgi:hypothetical protein
MAGNDKAFAIQPRRNQQRKQGTDDAQKRQRVA